MGCIKDIPTLKGDNYAEWKKKLDLAFILGKVDWVLTTPYPIEPAALVRGEGCHEHSPREYCLPDHLA